jgi:hypothetical protein
MPSLSRFKTSQLKHAIDGVTKGYEFLMDNPLDVGGKKKINMDMPLLRT